MSTPKWQIWQESFRDRHEKPEPTPEPEPGSKPKPKPFGLAPVEEHRSPWVLRQYHNVHGRYYVLLVVCHLRRLPQQRQQPFVAKPHHTHEVWLQAHLDTAGETATLNTIFRAQMDLLRFKASGISKSSPRYREIIHQTDMCAIDICDRVASVIERHGVMANLADTDGWWTEVVRRSAEQCRVGVEFLEL